MGVYRADLAGAGNQYVKLTLSISGFTFGSRPEESMLGPIQLKFDGSAAFKAVQRKFFEDAWI